MPAAAGSRTITINIRALTGELTSGMQKASAETKAWGAATQTTIAQVEQATERLSRLWRAAFEAFLADQVVNALKNLALGADEASAHLDVAARVAKNFGHSLDAKQMEGWLDKFAMSAEGGGYAINDMRAAVQKFAAVGLDGAQIQRALAETANLAAARQLDFGEAAEIVAKGLTGHIEMWTRYGIITRETAKNIHTTEDAFKALDKAVAGAAAQRANKLATDFGRLGTAASLLADKVGGSLAPFFTDVATALTKLVQLLDEVPAPVLKVAGSLLAFGGSLVAVTLVLPAVFKGAQIVGEGFRLMGTFVLPLITFVGRLAQTLGFAATGFEAFTTAELASVAPIAAIIVAIAGIGVAVVEITRHMDHVKTAWHDWTQYLSDSFSEFVNNFQRDSSVLTRTIEAIGREIKDTMTFQWGKLQADDRAVGMAQAPKATIKDWSRVSKDEGAIGADIVGDWRKIGAQVLDAFKNLFKSSLGPSPKIPHPPYDNTVPGKSAGNAGPAAAEDRLKNLEEGAKELIAAVANRVADARHVVEKSTTAVDEYKAGLPGGQPQNAAQQAKLQKLITNEMRAQLALRDGLQEQQIAEQTAAKHLEQYTATISTHLKNHDQLVRQAKDAALEHLRAAQQLNEEYLKIGVTVAQLKNDIRASFESLVTKTRETSDAAADALLDQQKIQNEADQAAIQQQIDMLPYGGAGALSFNGPAAQGPHERSARAQAETESTHPGSKNANVEADRLKIALAELAVAIAQDVEDDKAKHVTDAQTAANTLRTADAQRALTEANNAYAQAVIDATKASNNLTLAQAKLIEDQQQKWDQLINGLVEKIGAPGLTVNPNTAALSFDPTQLFMAALEQSQTFGDVMATVTQIVQTFAQAINAFRPIIHALLDVVRAVTNVFIFMYNAVARLLDLFGLQIHQLNYLNAAIGNLVPLLSIVHAMPTLNELAAGKLNSPLSTTPQGVQNLGGPGQGQNALMKVVELLSGILIATLLERIIATGSLQVALQQTAHLVGINIGTNKIPPTMTVLSAQQKLAITSTAQQSNAIAQVIGAKAAASSITTNTLLTQILAAINSMLAQMATANAGGFGGILKTLLGGVGASGGAGGGGGAFGPAVQQGIQSFSESLQRGVRAIAAHSQALADGVNTIREFTSEIHGAAMAARVLRSSAGLDAISVALSRDTSRRIAVSGYGIDRAPGL